MLRVTSLGLGYLSHSKIFQNYKILGLSQVIGLAYLRSKLAGQPTYEVPEEITDDFVLRSDTPQYQKTKYSAYTTASVLSGLLIGGLSYLYRKTAASPDSSDFLKSRAGKGLHAVVMGFIAYEIFSYGSNKVTSIQINNDLEYVVVRTGHIFPKEHLLRIKDISKHSSKSSNSDTKLSFTGKVGNSSRVFVLGDDYSQQNTGLVVTNRRLLHDIIHGDHQAATRYRFRNH